MELYDMQSHNHYPITFDTTILALIIWNHIL